MADDEFETTREEFDAMWQRGEQAVLVDAPERPNGVRLVGVGTVLFQDNWVDHARAG